MGYLAEAAGGRNGLPYYVFTILCVIAAFVLGQYPLHAVVRYRHTRHGISSEQVSEFYGTLDFASIGIPSSVGLLLLMLGFVFAFAVLWACMIFVHRRSLRSLITPARLVAYPKLWFAFALWFVILIAGEIVLYSLSPADYQWTFSLRHWLPLMVVVLLIVPVQASFEELFIRGYLLQGISWAANRAWIGVILTSVVFALLHLGNPEIARYGRGIMLTYYVSVGIFFAVITVLSDGLEYALGIHVATNVYGAGFVSYQGAVLQTDTMFHVTSIDPWVMLGLFYGMAVLFIFIVRRKFGLKPLRAIIAPVRNFNAINDSKFSVRKES